MRTTCAFKDDVFFLNMESGSSFLNYSFSKPEQVFRLSGSFSKGSGKFDEISEIVFGEKSIILKFGSAELETVEFLNVDPSCIDHFKIFLLGHYEANKNVIDMAIDVLSSAP